MTPRAHRAAVALDLAIVVDRELVGEIGFSSFDEPVLLLWGEGDTALIASAAVAGVLAVLLRPLPSLYRSRRRIHLFGHGTALAGVGAAAIWGVSSLLGDE